MKVLIIGVGMYVTGRNNTGVGTVLASLTQSSQCIQITEVIIVARRMENERYVNDAVKRINNMLNADLQVKYIALGDHPHEALDQLCQSKDFDCAIICVPDHLHYDYTKQLVKKKIHCLVVKPFTPTLEQARELINLQTDKGVYGAVEFHKRFDESNLYVKKAIREGKLGDLLYFVVEYSQQIHVPRDVFKEWAPKTNIFQYLGVHYVDLIYFLTGFVPARISAIGMMGKLQSLGVDTFDSVHVMMEWQQEEGDRSFVAQFATNWIDPDCTSALSDQKYRVVGTEGRLDINQKNRGIELVSGQDNNVSVNPYFSDFLDDPNGKMVFSGYGHKSIHCFVSDVLGIKESRIDIKELVSKRPSFQQACVSSAVIDAANTSLKHNGEWIDINVREKVNVVF